MTQPWNMAALRQRTYHPRKEVRPVGDPARASVPDSDRCMVCRYHECGCAKLAAAKQPPRPTPADTRSTFQKLSDAFEDEINRRAFEAIATLPVKQPIASCRDCRCTIEPKYTVCLNCKISRLHAKLYDIPEADRTEKERAKLSNNRPAVQYLSPAAEGFNSTYTQIWDLNEVYK